MDKYWPIFVLIMGPQVEQEIARKHSVKTQKQGVQCDLHMDHLILNNPTRIAVPRCQSTNNTHKQQNNIHT